MKTDNIFKISKMYNTLVFDLNGVVWSRKSRVYPQMKQIFSYLSMTKKIYFLTNSKESKYTLCGLFRDQNLLVNPQQIYSYGDCVTEFVENVSNPKVFIIGYETNQDLSTQNDSCVLKENLVNSLEEANILLLDTTAIIENFDYILHIVLQKNIVTLCKNDHRCRKYINSIEESGGKVFRMGKPHSYIFENFLSKTNSNVKDILFFGNKLATDIIGCNNVGISSALMLNHYEPEDLKRSELELQTSSVKPDYIVELHT